MDGTAALPVKDFHGVGASATNKRYKASRPVSRERKDDLEGSVQLGI